MHRPAIEEEGIVVAKVCFAKLFSYTHCRKKNRRKTSNHWELARKRKDTKKEKLFDQCNDFVAFEIDVQWGKDLKKKREWEKNHVVWRRP